MSGRVAAIEPEHVRGIIIPDAHHEDHSLRKGSAHVCETAICSLIIWTAKRGSFGGAKGVGDGVVGGGDAGNVGGGVMDHFPVLYVEPADLDEFTLGGVIGCEKLRNDGELGGGIDGQFRAEEGSVAQAIRVEVTAGFVARVGAGSRVDAGLAARGADVGCIGGSDAIGFPDVHFVAAGAVSAIAGSAGGASPVHGVGLRR